MEMPSLMKDEKVIKNNEFISGVAMINLIGNKNELSRMLLFCKIIFVHNFQTTKLFRLWE